MQAPQTTDTFNKVIAKQEQYITYSEESRSSILF